MTGPILAPAALNTLPAVESSLVVRAVFALLVAATAGAFLLAQTLKTEEPLVLRFSVKPRHISPNGDRVREEARVGFDISEPAEVSFAVIDSEGSEVRRIVDDRRLAGDTRHRFFWDGRDDDEHVVPDGTYRLRVTRRKENRVVDSFKTVRVDTKPPRVELLSAKPSLLAPGLRGGPRRVRLRYRGPRNLAPEFRVFRTGGRGPAKLVRLFRGDDTRTGVWDGTVRGGPTPSGNYAFNVKVRDLAGNKAEAPAPIPDARDARPGTGVTVSRFSLRGPMGVVPAGSIAVLRVGPVARRFQFALSRLGSARAIRRDRRRGGRLRVRIPRRARTGVYLVRVRASGRRAVWPLAVAGVPPRRASRRPRPLVVLPVVSWQGTNKVDSDHDGFSDTLHDARAVPPERPFAGGRLPGSFHAEAAPLLRFLDRERLPYDLTTDLSLARREGPTVGNAPGVAIAGTATWVPRRVRGILREEVERRGLKLVSFGAGSLRRTVSLLDGRLRGPTPPRGADLFGERTRLFRTDPAAPLRSEEDRLGLFRGVDSLFGEFSRFERSLALPDGARLLTSAGRAEGEPAFVAYRLGRGTVVRPGTPQWTRELRESTLSVEVPRVTRRIWALLARAR
jgi:hypothetical protein